MQFFHCRNLWIVSLGLFAATLWADEPAVLTENKRLKNENIVAVSHASELKNRFRIDHLVEKVTLLIVRHYGSSPVIVITPDGTKWYEERHPDNVRWVSGVSGDMISIEKPVPGPYQLIGTLVKGSSVEKVSELSVDITPLPQPLYQGERLKTFAKLIGDDKLIRIPGLDYLIEWRAQLASRQKDDEQNRISGTFPVGNYQDNGEVLDENPDDGIFTANLNLQQAWGSYRFIVTARNKMLERQVSMSIYLSPAPVTLNIIKPKDLRIGNWTLDIQLDDAQIIPSKTYLKLAIMVPGEDEMSLTVDKLLAGSNKIALQDISAFGKYRVTGFVASTTQGGREILLDIPELYFNHIEPPPPPPDPAVIAAEEAKIEAAKAREEKQLLTIGILVSNLLLLFLGGGIMLWCRRKKQWQHAVVPVEPKTESNESESKSAKTETDVKDEDNGLAELEDIDLNLPDEAGKS